MGTGRRWIAAVLGAILFAGGTGSSDGAPASVSRPSALAATSAWWKPRPGLSWQVQYAGRLVVGSAKVVDVDGHETSAATVAKLHRAGRKVICYVNAGASENWRPDKGAFPAAVIGKPVDGWPGERWLDLRRLDVLVPIMTARLDECRRKGFDAVDPDNLDGYQNDSGFPLTSADALAYLTALSTAAHARGLAIGLKNTVDLIARAEPLVEFAVNEECLRYHECGSYWPLLDAHKAVFHVEYSGSVPGICRRSPKGFSTIRKHLSLDGWVRRC